MPSSSLLLSELARQAALMSRWRPGHLHKVVTEHHGKELQVLLPSTNTELQQNVVSH